MKLSAAIEQAVQTQYYHDMGFMCHALQAIDQYEHVPAVEAKVREIGGDPDLTVMSNALQAWGIPICDMDYEEEINYLKQFYCWWVFDLKRKGL